MLKDILALHKGESTSPNSLPKVVGDGYLYKQSEVFRNLRHTFIDLGGRFDDSPPFGYFGFRMFALLEVLNHKVVPYVDNVSILEKLESEQPRYFSTKILGRVSPLKQPIAHETAHVVANEIFSILDGGSELRNQNISRESLVKVILCESFASTVETLVACGNTMKKSEAAQWFLDCNLYFDGAPAGISKMIGTVGLKKSTQLLTCLYAYSNFLYSRLGLEERKLVFEIVGLEKSLLKDQKFMRCLKDLESQAFAFSISFRVNTSPTFLRRLGYRQTVNQLFNFDPMKAIQKSTTLRKGLELMSQVADGTFEKEQNKAA